MFTLYIPRTPWTMKTLIQIKYEGLHIYVWGKLKEFFR